MADTVPAVSHEPLVPHDRSSVRQKRPRSRVKFCAVLQCLSVMGFLMVASRASAQNRVPARDSLVAPRSQVKVSADTVGDSPAKAPGSLRLFTPQGAELESLSIRRARLLWDSSWPAWSGTSVNPFAGQVDPRPPQQSSLLAAPPDIAFRLNSRLEGKVERVRNDRCAIAQFRAIGSNCSAAWTPGFNFQLDVISKGTVADRVHVDLDFNSQREYDGSNNISVRYDGKPGRAVESVEIGNISFLPPPSRFITSGIPSGNYGVLARGRIGALTYTGVAAQQRGNVTKDRTFTIGTDGALQLQTRALEDVGMELRRFFLTVDPRQFAGYPNIDILNRSQMLRLATSLPDSVRPSRLYIYKQLIGAINPNPNGPRLEVRGARNSSRQIYEVLRENVDYYVDPSQLWIALVAPLAENERLAVAYEVNLNGVPGRNVNTGGTPDVQYTEAKQFANLLWEPELQPTDANGYFQREVKSVYRLGGDEIRRESITLKIVTGTSGDQEKPRDTSRGATYLQLFGMAQVTNPGALDIENRVWPRPQDPNRLATEPTQKLLRDNFLVFPSLQPFARAGLAQPFVNPANDTLYTYPNEYLYSTQRPQSIFRLQTQYVTEGYGTIPDLELGTQQIRPLSERVLLDGQPLIRDIDYTTNYELGVINFNRADTLFLQPRQVVVRFEENQSLATSPTSIFGLSSLLNLEKGQIGFTAISQQQRSTYNRPPLGFESAGSLVAGITANFGWNATALTGALNKLPFATRDATSRIRLIGELAISKPQPNAAGQAYLATFEDNAGRSILLPENSWALSSQPVAGSALPALLGGTQLTLNRNSTFAFQNAGLDPAGTAVQFYTEQIDPRVLLRGGSLQSVEQVLWLTLFPLRVGGLLNTVPGTTTLRNQWTIGNTSSLGATPTGRRWGSIQTVLNPSGDDLSRIENVEFFALIDTSAAGRARNPMIVLDFGDISENRVAFAPETLTVAAPIRAGLAPDTTYRGKRLVGYDQFDSERDRFSRAFNAIDNDVGIAGSVADSIWVVDGTAGAAAPFLAEKVPICAANVGQVKRLGDSRANCTVRNNRLDEEDIDLDGQLNLPSLNADREQWKRFEVDLSDRKNWTRVGGCRNVVTDSSATLGIVSERMCWVQVRLNWRSPTDSLNTPNDRRVRALRLTMVSAADESDDAFTRTAIANFELVGA
ncbi:MAG: cell surface protein SprA, partial [Phycisphaerae bacterium]|nr:cell surface protein SprA [Gemmatimonadaceae bacterium]